MVGYDEDLFDEIKNKEIPLTELVYVDEVFTDADGYESIVVQYKNSYADGGRVDKMVDTWEKYGWAYSHINNNDNEFFERINKQYEDIGTTSESGTDIIFYDNDRNWKNLILLGVKG